MLKRASESGGDSGSAFTGVLRAAVAGAEAALVLVVIRTATAGLSCFTECKTYYNKVHFVV